MLRILSFNIRYNNPADDENAWPHRKEHVVELLNRHQLDLIGLQEVQKNQLDDLIPRLPDFDWVGVGRDDGKTQGEYAAVFYHRTRLGLVDSGSVWLSATPDVPGSVGWDASMARIATWGEFQDHNTGDRFLHVNTHFDHRGLLAQVESARLLRRFLAERATSIPAIITGDFNIVEDSAPYRTLTEAGAVHPPLQDAMHLTQTPHQGPNATFNGDFTDPVLVKIDYIFVWQPDVQQQSMQVQQHAILDDKFDGRYPSDHLPVMADILLQ